MHLKISAKWCLFHLDLNELIYQLKLYFFSQYCPTWELCVNLCLFLCEFLHDDVSQCALGWGVGRHELLQSRFIIGINFLKSSQIYVFLTTLSTTPVSSSKGEENIVWYFSQFKKWYFIASILSFFFAPVFMLISCHTCFIFWKGTYSMNITVFRHTMYIYKEYQYDS